jgi:ribosomal protein S18 acetylase RimI-like enzyme
MPWATRPLDPSADADKLVALWERSIPTWPIPRDRLLSATHSGHVAEHDGRIVGAIATHPEGAVRYLMVDPAMRRRGIGSALHDVAIASLGPLGRTKLLLGWGGRPYIWPGIPRDLPGAQPFFERRGWVMKHISADLAQDLSTYVRPKDAFDRAAAAGVTFAICRVKEREHGAWVPFFREHLSQDPASILLGRDAHGDVVGALLMETRPRHASRWPAMLGDHAAEIGCVGVAAHRNGEGIGTALMAIATEHVRNAGARMAFLSWTVRFSFYERLGYRIWRDYRMAEIPL